GRPSGLRCGRSGLTGGVAGADTEGSERRGRQRDLVREHVSWEVVLVGRGRLGTTKAERRLWWQPPLPARDGRTWGCRGAPGWRLADCPTPDKISRHNKSRAGC